MDGILLVDKPQGWTSFDVVAKVRSLLRASGVNKPKVGHAGTLDPLATGLLVLLVGSATKRAAELSKLDKIYEVHMKLGETSTTGDEEGQKTIVSDIKPTIKEVNQALLKFTGEIMQTPPVYSAIKVNGQRAYKLARQGKMVKLEARPVTIYKSDLISYEYPIVEFHSHVSSGTYIRSLASDIGKELDTGAYMTGLRRTQIGQFNITDAMTIGQLTPVIISQIIISFKQLKLA